MNIPAGIQIEIALDAIASEPPARRVEQLAECAHELYSVGAPQFVRAGFGTGTLTFDAGYFIGLRVAAALIEAGGEL